MALAHAAELQNKALLLPELQNRPFLTTKPLNSEDPLSSSVIPGMKMCCGWYPIFIVALPAGYLSVVGAGELLYCPVVLQVRMWVRWSY